jgi:hypothetical protein
MNTLRATGLGFDRIAAQPNTEGPKNPIRRTLAWAGSEPDSDRQGKKGSIAESGWLDAGQPTRWNAVSRAPQPLRAFGRPAKGSPPGGAAPIIPLSLCFAARRVVESDTEWNGSMDAPDA